MWKFSPKVLFLVVSYVMIINQSLVNSASIKCEYKTSSRGWFYGIDESVYYCEVKDNGIFTGERVRIDSADGVHATGHTNNDVKGLRLIFFSTVKFFPQNLENVYGNLILITIVRTNLQEIKQQDIKAFAKLRYIGLSGNKITTIDEDLFKFNPGLRAIYLHNNQISHVDPNVFDHLNNLIYLYLSGNQCKNALNDAPNSRSEVLKLIQRVRDGDCTSQIKKITLSQAEVIERNLTAVIEQKSNQVKEMEEKLRNVEKTSQEKIKILEQSNAELNKNLKEQREQNQKLQGENKKSNEDLTEIQRMNQELRTKNENLTLELNTQSKNQKLDDLNGQLHECKDKMIGCKDKMNELKDKYIKLIESEKIVASQNDEQKNTAGDSCMTLFFNNQQTPIILVN